MKLVADESVEREIVVRLRSDGHSVTYIAELSPSADDDAVLKLARDDEALLITGDKDFGELVYRLERASNGVMLLRLAGLSNATKAESVSRAIQQHEAELPGAFSVVSPGAIRIRRRNTDS